MPAKTTNVRIDDQHSDEGSLPGSVSSPEQVTSSNESVSTAGGNDVDASLSFLGSPRLKMPPDFVLLDGACPTAKVAGQRKITSIFCLPDGTTQHMGKRTANEIYTVLSKKVTGPLWRDLRPLLDPTECDFKLFIRSNTYVSEQAVLPRRTYRDMNSGGVQWVAIRTDFVSAFIESSRVLFILHRGENATFRMFLDEFQRILPAAGRFDHVTLDALLAASLKIHKMRFRILKPIAVRILDEVSTTMSEDSIARLFPVRRCIGQFRERLRPMNSMLHHFVWEKEDPNADFEDITDLLHQWLDGVGEVVADVNELSGELEDAERFINASMNSARNRYLVLEIVVAIITLSFSFGSLTSGIFGMNLLSGMEKDAYAFFGAVACILIVAVVINFCGYFYFARSKPSQRFGKLIGFGENIFFQNFNSDSYLFKLHQDNAEDAITQVMNHAFLEKRKPARSPKIEVPAPAVWKNQSGSPLLNDARSPASRNVFASRV